MTANYQNLRSARNQQSDTTTGAVINGPATKTLNVYEVQEVGGSIRIRA